jgi:hypothetical protein
VIDHVDLEVILLGGRGQSPRQRIQEERYRPRDRTNTPKGISIVQKLLKIEDMRRSRVLCRLDQVDDRLDDIAFTLGHHALKDVIKYFVLIYRVLEPYLPVPHHCDERVAYLVEGDGDDIISIDIVVLERPYPDHATSILSKILIKVVLAINAAFYG